MFLLSKEKLILDHMSNLASGVRLMSEVQMPLLKSPTSSLQVFQVHDFKKRMKNFADCNWAFLWQPHTPNVNPWAVQPPRVYAVNKKIEEEKRGDRCHRTFYLTALLYMEKYLKLFVYGSLLQSTGVYSLFVWVTFYPTFSSRGSEWKNSSH